MLGALTEMWEAMDGRTQGATDGELPVFGRGYATPEPPGQKETHKATDIQADDADHSRGYLVFSGECKDNVRPEIPHPIYEDIPR